MVKFLCEDFEIDNIELVIFDKDGTFIDIHTYWGKIVELRAKKIIEYFSMSEDFFEQLCNLMGYNIKTKKLPFDSPVGLYARGKVQEILLHYLLKIGIDASYEDVEKIFYEVSVDFLLIQDEYTVIVKEAVELMESLSQKGVKMVVVTSDSKRNAIRTVEKNGLLNYFIDIYGAEDSASSKTSGEIVKKILKKFSLKSKNVICIGDTYDDFLMAKNSDLIACVNVSTGVVSFNEMKEYNHYCVKSLGDIKLI